MQKKTACIKRLLAILFTLMLVCQTPVSILAQEWKEDYLTASENMDEADAWNTDQDAAQAEISEVADVIVDEADASGDTENIEDIREESFETCIDESSLTDGTLLTEENALPQKPEEDATVFVENYYCKISNFIRKDLEEYYSEEIYSEIATVSVIETTFDLEGKGSASEPFVISDLADLEMLRAKVNEEGIAGEGLHFKLTSDISLPSDWMPIGALEPEKKETGNGKYLRPFSGYFDGGGHTVTVARGGRPLFGYVRAATIQNLNIYGEQIAGYGLVDDYTVDYGPDGDYSTGVPAGPTIRNVTIKSGTQIRASGLLGGYASGSNHVLIENCTVESGVVIGYTRNHSSIGSLAGSFNGVVRGCTSAAAVYGAGKVGGLVGAKGQSMGACRIENSSFTGTVVSTGSYAGGILGSGYEADSAPNTPVAAILNCYVAGTVQGKNNVGGIFGGEPSCKQCWGNGGGGVDNCFFCGTVSGSVNVGGIIGFLKSFDKFQGISNNYYLDSCGASKGIGAVENVLTVEKDPTYGIDYEFDQAKYCFAKNTAEFADGTVTAGLNSGNYHNWENGGTHPVFGSGAYPVTLAISGDYRTKFTYGEAIDLSGGTFTVRMSDGSVIHPTADEIEVVGYDEKQLGSQMLRLKYGSIDTTITVAVLAGSGQISVKLTLLGDSVHNSDADKKYHTLSGDNLQTWIPETSYIVAKDATVKDVLEKALAEHGMTCKNERGNYVQSITRNGVELEEFSNGRYSGWMYTLNGKHPDLAVNQQYLANGDKIVFHYTDYYMIEEHEHHWSVNWKYDAKSHWYVCEYNCGLKKDEALHRFGAWTVMSPATLSAAQVQGRACIVCGYTEKKTVGAPLEKPKPKPTMALNATDITLKVKQSSSALKVTGLIAGDRVVSWKSSNTKVFTVNASGKMTGRKAGKATLTITLKSGLTRTVAVKVQKGTVKTTKISGLAKSVTLKKGKKLKLSPVLYPITTQQKATYSSSNKKIAAVNSKGEITAKKPGKAKIIVKSGSKKFTVTVTVTK